MLSQWGRDPGPSRGGGEEDNVPAEENVTHDVAACLRSFALERMPRGNKGTYATADKFSQAHDGSDAMCITYVIGAAKLQGFCDPVAPTPPEVKFTSAMELDPMDFHLEGTHVYVFNPHHLRSLWACKEVSGTHAHIHACEVLP